MFKFIGLILIITICIASVYKVEAFVWPWEAEEEWRKDVQEAVNKLITEHIRLSDNQAKISNTLKEIIDAVNKQNGIIERLTNGGFDTK